MPFEELNVTGRYRQENIGSSFRFQNYRRTCEARWFRSQRETMVVLSGSESLLINVKTFASKNDVRKDTDP